MVRVGINLWFKDLKNLGEILAKARSVGMDHVEISLDYPFGIVERDKLMEMVRRVRGEGMSISIHAPWQEIHLASPIEEVRRGSIEFMKRVLDICYHVEALYVVLHVTSEQPICRRLPPNSNPCIEAAIGSLEELSSYATDRGMFLAVENVGENCCGRIDLYSAILSQCNAYACLDPAHAIAMDRELQKKLDEIDYADVVREYASSLGSEKIVAMHLHGIKKVDNRRIEVHYELDGVKIDLKRIIKTTRPSLRFIVFEVFKTTRGNFDVVMLEPYVREIRSWATAYGV